MSRLWPLAAVLLALIGVGVYGVLRPGAEPGRDPADVQRRLTEVPVRIDRWTSTGDEPLDARTLNVGRFQAYLNRTYTRDDGAAVGVMVLYGEPGDIAAHDPTVCYAGGGWELTGRPTPTPVGGSRDSLWAARFRKSAAGLDVYWGWGVNGVWRAADNPRFEFARHRRIYKLYAQRVVADGPTPPATPDSMADFLPRFLDRLTDAVNPTDR